MEILALLTLSQWLYLNIVLQVLDGLSTWYALTKVKGLGEANPIGKHLFDKVGIIPGIILIKGATIALMAYFATSISVIAFAAIAVFYVVVVANNVNLIRKAK